MRKSTGRDAGGIALGGLGRRVLFALTVAAFATPAEAVELGPGQAADLDGDESGGRCVAFASGRIESVEVDETHGQPAVADATCRRSGKYVSCERDGRTVVACDWVKKRPRLFIGVFKDESGDDGAAALIGDVLAAYLSNTGKFEVTSAADLEAGLDLEEDRAALGSVAARQDLALMLNAQYYVTGEVRRDGKIYDVHTQLMDAESAVLLAEVSIDARSLEEVAERMPVAGEYLVSTFEGSKPPPPDPVYKGRLMTQPISIWSSLAVGAAFSLVVTVGAVVGVIGFLVFPHPLLGVPGFAIIFCAALVAGAVALAGDIVVGAEPNWVRAAWTAAAATAITLFGLPAAVVFGAILAGGVYQFGRGRSWATYGLNDYLTYSRFDIPVSTAATAVPVVVGGAVALGFAHWRLLGVFPDELSGGE